jgi:hypothetical protein
MNATSEMPQCTACLENGVVALAGQALCLGHFFQGCYKRLEQLDPVVRGRLRECTTDAGASKALEEVAKQVLIVCLQHENLSNLDRSRLLDILLWSGELQFLLRVPRSVSYDGIAYGANRRRNPVTVSLSGKQG